MATGARTATRVRTVRRDKLDPTPDDAPNELHLSGLIVLPRQFYEQDRGWVTIEGYDIYILPSSRVAPVVGGPKRPYADGDIVADDQLEIDGALWEVDGPPAGYDKGAVRKATLVKVKKVGS